MKKIRLTQNRFALVDDDDFERVNALRWLAAFAHGHWYAAREHNGTTLSMHRFILGITSRKIWVDHRDNDGLNNQRNNLRACTPRQNCRNRKINKNNSSGFKGVTIDRYKSSVYYVATICVNYRNRFIGQFKTAREAAKAYDREAIKLHGDFRRTNFERR